MTSLCLFDILPYRTCISFLLLHVKRDQISTVNEKLTVSPSSSHIATRTTARRRCFSVLEPLRKRAVAALTNCSNATVLYRCYLSDRWVVSFARPFLNRSQTSTNRPTSVQL